ncbi:hypothetical protein F4810DRAFT_113711 [Camillea tinctor]|nr:hypothetical protein F4810DRAFT_113711 [Camillea tinctor]
MRMLRNLHMLRLRDFAPIMTWLRTESLSIYQEMFQNVKRTDASLYPISISAMKLMVSTRHPRHILSWTLVYATYAKYSSFRDTYARPISSTLSLVVVKSRQTTIPFAALVTLISTGPLWIFSRFFLHYTAKAKEIQIHCPENRAVSTESHNRLFIIDLPEGSISLRRASYIREVQ